MNKVTRFAWMLRLQPLSLLPLIAGILLGTGHFSSVWAQGQIASGTVNGAGAGPYAYSLTFSDSASATAPIGSVWYAWVPGLFYLPGTPTSASAPAGWTATVFGNSVQYAASSSAFDILPGNSLSGFGYQAAFSPAQLAAAPNSGVSVAYSGGFFSDAGNTFTMQPVPEPASEVLLLAGATLLWLVALRKPHRI